MFRHRHDSLAYTQVGFVLGGDYIVTFDNGSPCPVPGAIDIPPLPHTRVVITPKSWHWEFLWLRSVS